MHAAEDAAVGVAQQHLAAAIDAKEFAELLPGRVNKVMDALAEASSRSTCRASTSGVMRGIQKIANRVTTGVIVAALVIGAAMIMRSTTDPSSSVTPPSPS